MRNTKFILFLLFIFLSPYLKAQIEKKFTRILFIFDASNSMNAKWESENKIDIASRRLIELVDSLDDIQSLELALRIYGHQYPVPPQVCTDSKLEVKFAPRNGSKIKAKLNSMKAQGTTPIAYSLQECANDFPAETNVRNIVILITDGIEACDGDPCAVALALQSKGIILKPFIIGVGLDLETRQAFECLGHYFDADEEDDFYEVLQVVVSQALNTTTAQVNLLDTYGKPTETDVNMTFYDAETEKMKYNYIHTLNELGNPDTLILDPLVTYEIAVHTIPPIKIKNVKLTAGKHNIISADAPQGFLRISEESGTDYANVNFIVRKKEQSKTLNVQYIRKTEKYITGKYDLEVLCLPRLYYSNVEIKQSEATEIKIPAPGRIKLEMPDLGYGSLYLLENNKANWIYNLNNVKETSILLQPGEYMVVFRSKKITVTTLSISKSFIIKSGSTTYLKL